MHVLGMLAASGQIQESLHCHPTVAGGSVGRHPPPTHVKMSQQAPPSSVGRRRCWWGGGGAGGAPCIAGRGRRPTAQPALLSSAGCRCWAMHVRSPPQCCSPPVRPRPRRPPGLAERRDPDGASDAVDRRDRRPTRSRRHRAGPAAKLLGYQAIYYRSSYSYYIPVAISYI